MGGKSLITNAHNKTGITCRFILIVKSRKMSNEAYGENLAAEVIGASKLPGRKNNMARFSKGEYRNHEYSIVPLAEIAGKFGIEQVAGSETPIYYSREGERFLTEITP